MSDEENTGSGMSEEDAALAAAAFESFGLGGGEPEAEDPVAAAMAEMEGAGTAFEAPEFDVGEMAVSGDSSGLGMLDDVSLKVSVELGRTSMFVDDVLKLAPDAVVELDKAAGDPVDVFINGRHVARGEVLVLNENFCVRINEIIKQSDQDM